MTFLRVLVTVLAAAALAACGDSASVSGTGDKGDGFGSLDVTIHGLDSDDVSSIWVSLRGTGSEGPRNLKLSQDGGQWGGNFRNIAPGTYTAQAWAFEDDLVDPSIDNGNTGVAHDFNSEGGLLFKSVEVEVTIIRMSTTPVHFILHQQTKDGGDFTPPHISAVVFSRADVEQWETVDITVTAGPNPATLTGLGRGTGTGGEGWFVDAGALPPTWWDSDDADVVEGNLVAADALLENDSFAGNTAQLTWAPEPRTAASVQKVVLEVDDGNGNSTRIAFDIDVGGYAATFTTAFNHSPNVLVADVFSTIEDGSSSITFTVYAEDVNDPTEVTHSRMSYVVSSDCGGVFSSHADVATANGDFPPVDANNETSMVFTYTSDTPEETCEFEITVTNWVLNADNSGEDTVGAPTVYKLLLEDWAWKPFQ